jgi:hypothetical protein
LIAVRNGSPVYEGKPIKYWLQQRAAYGPELPKTFVVSREAGPEAVPFLVTALSIKDNMAKQSWRAVFAKLPLFAQKRLPLPIEPGRLRRAAAQFLGEMGTNALAAVPALNKALGDPDKRVQAAADFALVMIDAQSTRAALPEKPVWRLSLEPSSPRERKTNTVTVSVSAPSSMRAATAGSRQPALHHLTNTSTAGENVRPRP